MTFARELEVALGAATRAGRFIQDEYESFTPIPNAPADISTHVDRGSQDLVFQFLREHFPADGLCGEETLDRPAESSPSARRVWVIDPVDGTRGFAMKNGEFSVMIGLTVDRRPVVGVVLEPVTMRYTFAAEGGGCWSRTGDGPARRCRVSGESNPTACTLVQSRPKPKEVPTGPVKAVRPARVMEMYSAGVKMAVVARGEADVYANTYPNFSDWDICAGHVLVEEAGGRVTGFRGEPIGYGDAGFGQRRGMVASNAAIHNTVIELLRDTPLG